MNVLSQEAIDKICQMPQAKQEAVYAAALEEFLGGYRSASTDAIIARAGISKGLLFHYFGSKRNLLAWCWQKSAQVLEEQFTARIDLSERDFFRRLWRITSARFDLMAQHPLLFDFMAQTASSPEAEAKELVRAAGGAPAGVSLVEAEYFEDIDESLFKERLDIKKAVNVVRWTFSAFSAEAMALPADGDLAERNRKALQEIWEYISFFRKLLYK